MRFDISLRTAAIVACAAALCVSRAEASAGETLVIPMHGVNGSGEDGTATLTQVADGVRVVLTLHHFPDEAQPTHIHLGTCASINRAPEYGLQLTADGHSESVVRGVSLDDLRKQSYAINVHKSITDLGTYFSCGDIK